MSVEVLDYGGIVRTLLVPDRRGQHLDVVLGYDDIASYEDDRSYIGAIVGRYANRICGGMFELDGTTYHLSTNNGPNHLHGGQRGLDKVVWHSRPFDDGSTVGVVLSYTSPDGDEGYPGTLEVEVRYSLTDSSVFAVEYHAATDRATPVNLTHHGYFNLSGEGSGDVLGHELAISAESFLEIGASMIPTGRMIPVESTPLDFRDEMQIGARIGDPYEQMRIAGGYDHTFVLSETNVALRPAARAESHESGISMDVFTTEPGVQLYTGNFLDGSRARKYGHRYGPRTGFCLETQHFPDSPNHPEFPSTILRPGQELRSRTEYHFSRRL